MPSIHGRAPAGAALRLVRPDGSDPVSTAAGRSGEFNFNGLSAGWYILSASKPGLQEAVQAVDVRGAVSAEFRLEAIPPPRQSAPPVLTVCEALDRRGSLNYLPLVIVGIYKSGMDETLRLDCPAELRAGGIGFPASIGLTHAVGAPDNLRDQVERTRQRILKSAPPEAPLRPERVVGLYGRLVSLAGLAAAKCCSAPVESILPPARLFGLSETDLRVIRRGPV